MLVDFILSLIGKAIMVLAGIALLIFLIVCGAILTGVVGIQ